MHYSLACEVVSEGWGEDSELFANAYMLHKVDSFGNRWASPLIRTQWIESFRFDKDATLKMIDRLLFMPSRWDALELFAAGEIAIDHGYITEGNLLKNEGERRIDSSDWINIHPVYGTDAWLDNEWALAQHAQD